MTDNIANPTVAELAAELMNIKEDRLHTELSNTFLRIERGEEPLTITNSQRMLAIVLRLYGTSSFISEYWQSEFLSLPNWNNV